VPFIRTKRPLPVTFSVCVPPVPVVVEKIVVHVDPSGDTWIWNAVANAASHCNTTWPMVCVDPRSTWTHCGSLNALDQRVPGLPSVALAAGNDALSVDDAVVGLPCDSRVPAAADEAGVPTTAMATSADAASSNHILRSGRIVIMTLPGLGASGVARPGTGPTAPHRVCRDYDCATRT
jgi:hypothetical protein